MFVSAVDLAAADLTAKGMIRGSHVDENLPLGANAVCMNALMCRCEHQSWKILHFNGTFLEKIFPFLMFLHYELFLY